MSTSALASERILEEIEDADCESNVKGFLRKIFQFELRRVFGQEYKRRYEREIDKAISFEEE